MTNHELNDKMIELVKGERKITIEILHLINLAEDRKLHLEMGFGNIYEWLIKGHKYSEGAASRRIQAARMLRAVPAASAKINDGSINLSTLAKAQAVVRAQERVTGKRVSISEKARAVAKIENESISKSEQVLFSLFPDAASAVRQDRITTIDENTQRLGFNLSNEAMSDLRRATELLSHAVPSAQVSDVIAYLLNDFIKRKDPLVQSAAAAAAPRVTRKWVILRAKGACEYKDPITGRICGSRFQLEIDHIVPRARGGTDDPSNLRCLCRKHNHFMAEKILGKSAANCWR